MLWDVDDVIPCQKCKEPVYLVRKRITTKLVLADLIHCLEPYSDKVPKLDEGTPVKFVGNVAFNCPRCFEPWGVIVA